MTHERVHVCMNPVLLTTQCTCITYYCTSKVTVNLFYRERAALKRGKKELGDAGVVVFGALLLSC